MQECLIRNLCDSPRDYPKNNGSSVYLGSKGRSTGIARLPIDEVSEAMRAAERKGLLTIEEIPDEEASE